MTASASTHPRHIGTWAIPCEACAGKGMLWQAKFTNNDPDAWDAGRCEECDGSGDHACDCCGKHPAVATWSVSGRTRMVCRACHDEWVEDAA